MQKSAVNGDFFFFGWERENALTEVGVLCLSVWLGIMLPVLGVKSLSAYAIAYLERLLL